jgi:hypothetical protein
VSKQERTMTSFIKTSVLAVFLAAVASAASAAPIHRHHVTHIARAHSRIHVATRRTDRVRLPPSIADLIDGLLAEARAYGYAVPAHIALANVHWHVSRGGSDTSDWTSPSSDDTAAIDSDNAATQAAIDASNAGIQAANDAAAQAASMAAAEEQNDAANAAALQTELNANN